MQLYIDHNADVHACDGDGDSSLHCAAVAVGGRGQLEVARLLLQLNVEVNSRNNNGTTPLHLASHGLPDSESGGNPDIVRLLLDHGADVLARNSSGKIAAEIARGPKQEDIRQLLSQHAEK